MKIVFTKSNKKFAIGSWLISLYQRTEYSHVALMHGDYFYQANEGKVNKEYKTYFLLENCIVKEYAINDVDLGKIEQVLGLNYSTLQNIGIFLVDIVRLLKRHVSNPFTSGINCSEFAYEYVLKQIYPDLDYDKDYIKPKHIEQILKERCAKTT